MFNIYCSPYDTINILKCLAQFDSLEYFVKNGVESECVAEIYIIKSNDPEITERTLYSELCKYFHNLAFNNETEHIYIDIHGRKICINGYEDFPDYDSIF